MADYKITYADGTTSNIVATEEMARTVAGGGSYELIPIPQESDEQKAELTKTTERAWRDSELNRTDKFVTVPDHPQKDAYIAYRTKLRDWPATSNFPNTKPELGG